MFIVEFDPTLNKDYLILSYLSNLELDHGEMEHGLLPLFDIFY